MFRFPTTLLTLALALLWAGAGWANPAELARLESVGWQVPAWEARPSQSGMSLNEAIARARGRFPGRVVKAESKKRGARVEHVVRIINNQGRVRTFRIDAQTGEFL